MPLIKNGAILPDPWRNLSDDEPLADAPVIVSLERWQAERESLGARPAPLGIRLKSHQSPRLIADDLARFRLVAIEFPKFADGRGFSHARLLRDRFGFTGEVRAVGQVLRDQFRFLDRCGFDAIEIASESEALAFPGAITEIGVNYQPASDRRPWVMALRRAKTPDGETAVDAAPPANTSTLESRLALLRRRYEGLTGVELLRPILTREFKDKIALVSSFGTEAAVLLHMVAVIDPATPVIFLDTGKHFAETLRYRDDAIARFRLTDVRTVEPLAEDIDRFDRGDLWRRDPDRCCFLRKVKPLALALKGFDAWITGRKRYQNFARSALAALEVVDGRFKINPLADWLRSDIERYFAQHALPRHPLEADGYPSVGCWPCTGRVLPAEDARAGRWRGLEKTECGINLPNLAADTVQAR
jgi:phosphoadenosine phosphosulfate reductase